MTEYRSRRLNLKYQHRRKPHATRDTIRTQAAPALPPAPVDLEWCSDFHDKTMPEETPPRFRILAFIDERPFTATFLLLHAFFIVMALVSDKMHRFVASNIEAFALWLFCVVTVWFFAFMEERPLDVVFYRIDLASERILLHVRGRARGIRIMTLSFVEITSIYAFKYKNESTTCGVNIGYLDEGLKVRKLQAPDLIPETLAEAHMDALRPALGEKVEESVTHDY